MQNSKSFLICSRYRPPFAKSDWNNKFSNQTDNATSLFSEIYLMGDINIDMDNGVPVNSNWKNQLEIHDFAQLINVTTSFTAHSEKIIDHIYASDSSKVTEQFVPNIAISDHYPVLFTGSVSKDQLKRRSDFCSI